uniref:Uncharacterized protein n=1 Tax=Aegilops tauschii subsp. strangulata TaxID=200361 RepID=A0A453CVJ7_AEGTS
MRGGEGKPGRSPKRQLNAGYVVGGLLMLLTYLVAQHFAVSSPNGKQ